MDDPHDHNFERFPAADRAGKNLSLELLQAIPEEEVWLAGQLSPQTRQAYKKDVDNFIAAMKIRSTAELRQVSRGAVIAWQNRMREWGIKPRTMRRRLSALSSLFAHLVTRPR